MQFLVISNPKHPVPPEMGPMLIDAMVAWVDQNTAAGKVESTWGFAGTAGGGGILNVDSPEELDAIMAGYPFGAFSEVEVFPLVNLHESLQRTKQAMQAMAGG
jgi:muconolactone delta-isomerase